MQYYLVKLYFSFGVEVFTVKAESIAKAFAYAREFKDTNGAYSVCVDLIKV